MRYGPRYMLVGSSLTDDRYFLRLVLEALNRWGLQWSETLIILDNGSLPDLQHEVAEFRHLEYRFAQTWGDEPPNIVIAFLDRLSHNREVEELLRRAESEGISAYVVSRYGT